MNLFDILAVCIFSGVMNSEKSLVNLENSGLFRTNVKFMALSATMSKKTRTDVIRIWNAKKVKNREVFLVCYSDRSYMDQASDRSCIDGSVSSDRSCDQFSDRSSVIDPLIILL